MQNLPLSQLRQEKLKLEKHILDLPEDGFANLREQLELTLAATIKEIQQRRPAGQSLDQALSRHKAATKARGSSRRTPKAGRGRCQPGPTSVAGSQGDGGTIGTGGFQGAQQYRRRRRLRTDQRTRYSGECCGWCIPDSPQRRPPPHAHCSGCKCHGCHIAPTTPTGTCDSRSPWGRTEGPTSHRQPDGPERVRPGNSRRPAEGTRANQRGGCPCSSRASSPGTPKQVGVSATHWHLPGPQSGSADQTGRQVAHCPTQASPSWRMCGLCHHLQRRIPGFKRDLSDSRQGQAISRSLPHASGWILAAPCHQPAWRGTCAIRLLKVRPSAAFPMEEHGPTLVGGQRARIRLAACGASAGPASQEKRGPLGNFRCPKLVFLFIAVHLLFGVDGFPPPPDCPLFPQFLGGSSPSLSAERLLSGCGFARHTWSKMASQQSLPAMYPFCERDMSEMTQSLHFLCWCHGSEWQEQSESLCSTVLAQQPASCPVGAAAVLSQQSCATPTRGSGRAYGWLWLGSTAHSPRNWYGKCFRQTACRAESCAMKHESPAKASLSECRQQVRWREHAACAGDMARGGRAQMHRPALPQCLPDLLAGLVRPALPTCRRCLRRQRALPTWPALPGCLRRCPRVWPALPGCLPRVRPALPGCLPHRVWPALAGCQRPLTCAPRQTSLDYNSDDLSFRYGWQTGPIRPLQRQPPIMPLPMVDPAGDEAEEFNADDPDHQAILLSFLEQPHRRAASPARPAHPQAARHADRTGPQPQQRRPAAAQQHAQHAAPQQAHPQAVSHGSRSGPPVHLRRPATPQQQEQQQQQRQCNHGPSCSSASGSTMQPPCRPPPRPLRRPHPSSSTSSSPRPSKKARISTSSGSETGATVSDTESQSASPTAASSAAPAAATSAPAASTAPPETEGHDSVQEVTNRFTALLAQLSPEERAIFRQSVLSNPPRP